MVKLAVLKLKAKVEVIAGFKSQAQHFTIFELHFSEGRFEKISKAKVAIAKLTIYKLVAGKLRIREIQSFYYTLFIFSRGKFLDRRKSLIEKIVF